jgi:hypothetical protein
MGASSAGENPICSYNKRAGFPELTSSPNVTTESWRPLHLPDGLFDQTTSNAATLPTLRYCEPANPILRSIGATW